jgi:glycosyltransferase involved in cell wall biosynthesis
VKVLFNTYPMAFDVPGGGEMQLLAYREHLPAYGVVPTLFDLWQPAFRDHDLVHFFSVVAGSVHFCGHVKKLGLPLVVSSSLWITEETKHQYPCDEIRAQLSLADAVIVNSDLEGEQLARVFGLPRERFRTVYNGVDDAFLRPADPSLFRQQHGIPGRFLLNVANIEPRKNQLRFIEALQRHPELTLVVIGHIRDESYARACFEAGRGRVVHIPALPPGSALLRSAMAACTAFVMPSTLETPSIAALEAAALGARLLVTEVGSTREYFLDAVTYVLPDSPQSLAAGIAACVTGAPSDALGKRVRERYRWRLVVAALARCYADVCAAR